MITPVILYDLGWFDNHSFQDDSDNTAPSAWTVTTNDVTAWARSQQELSWAQNREAFYKGPTHDDLGCQLHPGTGEVTLSQKPVITPGHSDYYCPDQGELVGLFLMAKTLGTSTTQSTTVTCFIQERTAGGAWLTTEGYTFDVTGGDDWKGYFFTHTMKGGATSAQLDVHLMVDLTNNYSDVYVDHFLIGKYLEFSNHCWVDMEAETVYKAQQNMGGGTFGARRLGPPHSLVRLRANLVDPDSVFYTGIKGFAHQVNYHKPFAFWLDNTEHANSQFSFEECYLVQSVQHQIQSYDVEKHTIELAFKAPREVLT